MTTQELLRILKPIFQEVEKSEGKLSLMEAAEAIEEFKKQNQDETINQFLKTYGFLYKTKLAQRAKTFDSERFQNNKHPLVR